MAEPRSPDPHDARLLKLFDELGWQDLDFVPVAPDPLWRPDKSELDEVDRKVLDDVAEYGWHDLHIHPRPDDDPSWSFTIGLWSSYGHPELITFGLDHRVAHDLLTTAAQAAAEGRTYAAGEESDDFLEGYPVRFVAVGPQWLGAFMGYAQWFHETTDVPVLQLVWPDREGRWPWDPACSTPPGEQPVLGPHARLGG